MAIFERETPEIPEGTKYSVEKYQDIFDEFNRYILNTYKNAEDNWLLIEFLEENFDVPYDCYLQYMNFWAGAEKPDRVMRIFAKMKKLSKEGKLPPPDETVYWFLFKCFSKFKYESGIFKLHLSMKMDLAINVDIKLLNAVMEAYASLEDPFKTRDVFNLALSMPKSIGLNEESAYWMLKSLKFGSLYHVDDFYYNLSGYEVELTPQLFREYLIANCYFEQFGTAMKKLVRTFNQGDGHLIDKYVLKDFHNWCLNKNVRRQLDQFANQHYKEIWTELKSSGELSNSLDQLPSELEGAYNDEDPSQVLLSGVDTSKTLPKN
ncbi:unnamed protein product [Ambrosiozyma monospora]|uniref:Unnamed protein product n=1 Tax=Ambrosiozyma monospora TaxID=43982 RepID=A0ACB5TVA7_AMBMO|nr:unnamed protein product [Ambrosiozyma monospora]